MRKLAAIEALLFVAGDEGLTQSELSKLLNTPSDVVVASIEDLAEQYQANEDNGIQLIETANKYKLVTKKEYADYIKRYAQSPFSQTLSRPLLETLAIIAYKQPITRIEIEEVRGVQVTGNLKKLRTRQLIEEVGRLDKPGQPLLYGTTDFFLDYFGVNSIDDLPELKLDENEEASTDLYFKNFQQSFDDYETNLEEEE
jgi:segregation and condensation protein B